MKITINKSWCRRALFGLGLLLAAGACTKDPAFDDRSDDGSRSEMTLEFGVSASTTELRTRAEGGFANDAVQSLWVGVFDTTTGKLVGSTASGATPNENGNGSGTIRVNILYYDAHPTVRIFGVANYEGVKGTGGASLINQLGAVRTLDELFDLSVDTESADEALEANGAPLMMGVLAANGSGLAQDTHYTVSTFDDQKNLSGSSFNTPADWTGATDVRLIPENPSNSTNGMFGRLDYQVLNNHSIRLRRLLSEVNVQIKAGDGIEISKVQYRRVNMPKEVYLQERTTYSVNDADDMKEFILWANVTSNRADALVKGPVKAPDYTSDSSMAYASDESFSSEGVVDNSFTYYHYENKHWGLESVKSYADREERHKLQDGHKLPNNHSVGNVFSSLCYPSATDGNEPNDYNNYASYFEIKCEVHDRNNNLSAVATYLIHEGYCNNYDGTAATDDATRSRDFMCVRNTSYTYNVTINGLTSIEVTSSKRNEDHPNASSSGVLWKVYPTIVEDNDEVSGDGIVEYKYRVAWTPEDAWKGWFGGGLYELPAVRYRYVYQNGKDEPIVTGNCTDAEWDGGLLSTTLLGMAALNEVKPDNAEAQVLVFANQKDPDSAGEPFGEWLARVAIDPRDAHYLPNPTVYLGFRDFPFDITKENPEDYKQQLFIYEGGRGLVDKDGCESRCYSYFERVPADPREQLATPALTINPATFKEGTATAVEVSWEAVANAATYEVTYNGVTIVQSDCTFTISASEAALLATGSHEISVVAKPVENSADYKTSEVATISFEVTSSVVRLTWDFDDWVEDLTRIMEPGSTETSGWSVTKDGLTYNCYDGATRWNVESNGDCFIQPNGAGNENRRVFSFNAPYRGTLKVWAKSASSAEARAVNVVDASGTKSQTVDGSEVHVVEFAVQAGTVKIYPGGGIRFYQFEFTYDLDAPDPTTWNFSSSAWQSVLSPYGAAGADIPNWNVTVDGLQWYSPSNSRWNTTYIQSGNAGSTSDRYFKFTATSAGTLKVETSNTGSGDASDRGVAVNVGGTETRKYGGSPSNTAPTVNEFPINAAGEVYIYAYGGGLRFYSIEFDGGVQK